MRHLPLLSIAALLAIPSMVIAQQVGQECRREVIQLCGMTRDREVIRTCLKEKSSQLSGACREEIKARVGGAASGRGETVRAAPSSGGTEYSYGTDAAQRLDYYAVGNAKAPLVIFVHGGGWLKGDKTSGAGTKPAYYNSLGYAFASVNYRLVPAAKPDGQATDVANAVAYLRTEATKLGFDANQIIIMGHSAGAHLAALVSSDTRYFEKAGVPMSAIRGTVLLDGAGYDVPRKMANLGNDRAAEIYNTVFGKDASVQRALSPITYVASPNTASWLILYVASRDDSRAQSEALGKGLTANNASVTVKAVPDSSHMSVNQDAGKGGTFVGDAIAGFLAQQK